MSYLAFALLEDTSNPLDRVVSSLRTFFDQSGHSINQHVEIVRKKETMVLVSRFGFDAFIEFRCGEDVGNQNRCYADSLEADRKHLADSHARLEISTSPDSEMEYFNDFILLCEQLEKLGGIALIDGHSGKVM